MDWGQIGKWLTGVIIAAIAGGFVFKFVVTRRTSSRSSRRIVSQKNNIAGGDIVAGDSIKKNNK